MVRKNILTAAVATVFVVPTPVLAADDPEINKIREEIEAVKDGYETRLRQLEQRLEKAEQGAGATKSPTSVRSAPPSANALNPAISLILGGQFSDLQRDPASYQIGGFIPGGGEVGPGGRSFNLGESELNISANVDAYFSGTFIVAMTPENEAEVEEAFLQNSGFIPGTTLKFGRFFSAFGYQNEVHAHAWEFVDAPLVLQAFLGGQLKEEGIQGRWVAPTPIFLEVGVEAGRGANFPGSERNKNGSNSGEVFFHVGDDVGASNSYRIGASYRKTTAAGRQYEDVNSLAEDVINAFDGDSRMWGLDLVWKWAQYGDPSKRHFKFQAEYMRRKEDGTLTYDADGTSTLGTGTDSYNSKQSGWYAQAVYQFMPRWRFGLRFEELDYGTASNALVINGVNGLTAADFPLIAENDPKRTTVMMDFSPSEFSRFRLQFSRDEARFSESDNQIFLQYIMSLGAHGGHKF